MEKKKEELELFYRLDEKKYLVGNQPTLQEWFQQLDWTYQMEDIQDFIDKLASWYFVKYPDKYIEAVIKNHDNKTYTPNIGMSLESLFQNFDTLELDLVTFDDKNKEIKELICQYLLQLVGYKMIYYQHTLPSYGLFRIQFMFSDFNGLFHWNLNTDIYRSIMERDYSLNNPDNLQLLKTLREQNRKNKKRQRKKKGLRRLLQR